MTILVSACLLGVACRFDGASLPCAQVLSLMEKHTLIPVCPEILGGLPTPRPAAEIQGSAVCTKEGRDVSAAYQRGAKEALRLARLYGAEAAILKARSPSCGVGKVYDGRFSGTLIQGNGITAALLQQNGIPVFTEKDVENGILPNGKQAD
ncbi:MAG: DUF523 domain-containing protein [Clostridia bacterium]|nr:DUF523 domain-containing protein [Clostridia bacterium]